MNRKIIFVFMLGIFLLSLPRADAVTELRTVEYFIDNTSSQMAASAWWNRTFNFKLPDTSVTIKSAYVEIYGSRQSGGTVDTSVSVYFNNTLLGTYTTESGQEGYLLHIVSNLTQAFYTDDPSTSSQWQLAFKNGATDLLGGASAKLVVTYEYSGPPKTKTIRQFINSINASTAASGWANMTFPIKLNGTNPAVKSAFFEIYFVTDGTADTTPAIYLNNTRIGNPVVEGSAPSYGYFGMFNATGTKNPIGGIYNITDTTTKSYQLAFQCGAGGACEGIMAALVVTYESDAEAPVETATFFINNQTAQVAVNGWSNQTFWITLSDTNPVVQSAYFVIRGMLPNTAPTIKVYLNNTLIATPAYVATIEQANIMIFANASNSMNGLFLINDNSRRSYQLAITCSDECEALSTYLVLTYEYTIPAADSTPPQWLQNISNTSNPVPGGGVLLSANWTDGTELDWAFLETNETGTATNYTNGAAAYGSPMRVNLTGTNTWSNFTWVNPAIAGGTAVAWRIYANDTAGNMNATALNTFRIIQQLTQQASVSLTVNTQTQNLQSLFQIIKNVITSTLQVDKTSTALKLVGNSISSNAGVQILSNFLRVISNAVTNNVAVQTLSSFLRTISQAVSSNIVSQSISSFLRSISNVLTTNIVTGPLTNFFRIISNAVTTNSAADTVRGTIKFVSQAVTQNAAVQTTGSFLRAISNAITPNSITSSVSSILRPISQAITANTAVSSVSTFLKSISQAVTTNAVAKTLASLFRNISNAITTTSANQILSSLFRIVSQAFSDNLATRATGSFFKTISQALTANPAATTLTNFLKIISQAITENSATRGVGLFLKSVSSAITNNAVAQSISSIFKTISQTVNLNAALNSATSFFRTIFQSITENISINKVSLFFKTIQQSISPTASGSAAWYHRFFIFVSQQISANMEAMFGVLRAPPSPTGPTVAVIYTSSGTGDYSGFVPKIKPSVPIKPPPTAAIQFVKQPALREVEKGQPIVEGIIVKNIGTKTIEGLGAEISGIDSKWVTVLPSSVDLDPGEKTGFTLFITPPKDAQEGDYAVTITMKADGISDKTAFIMRVKTFEPVTDKAVVARAVSIDNEEQKSEVMLVVRNGPTKQENVKVTEVIKKEIASSADELEFSEQPEIIEKDPIVRWTIKELQPFETKNFTYTVKKVLQEYSPYVYWPTEELALPAISEVKDIRVLPLNPIELQPGKFVPVPVIIENTGNMTRNVSVTMRLPPGWELIPQIINETIAPNETKIFKFSVQIPRDEYPGYYIGKITIDVDGQIIKKEYEFAVLSNIALLVRPLVVVVSAFFIIGVFWIRLKLLELRTELESIKSLTEVKRTKEELEVEIEKTKKIVRDLDALYRDNVIDEETYLIERNTVNSKLRKMQTELEEVGKKATREKSKDNRKVRSINKEMRSFTDRLEKLEQDYSKNKIRKSFYTKEKRDIEKRIGKMQKELVGNKPLFDEIKRMLQNRKLMISGLQKIKRAYEEGFLEKFAYDSSKKELSEKLKKIDTILKKKYGMLDRERERMMGSNMLLRIAMKVES